MADIESLVPQVVERVKELRKARRWSCNRLAQELTHRGYDMWTRSTLANLENGRRESVTIDELVALGAVFGVAPWSLTSPDSRCPRCWDTPPTGFTCTSCGNTGPDDLPSIPSDTKGIMTMAIPSYSLDITGLTASRDDHPTGAVQYCVVDPNGDRHIYGDQEWVVSGQAVIDAHPGGHIEQRTITITYGEWSSIPSESRSNQ